MDKMENEYMDLFPSKTQRKYGRPDPKDVHINYRRIPLQEHLKRIRLIPKKNEKVETKIPKPRKIEKVDKSKIVIGGVI